MHFVSTQTSEALVGSVTPWLIALLVLVIAGAVLIYVVRRMAMSGSSKGSDGFALEDLRRMHRDGQLTDEEFGRAKAALIGRLRGSGGGMSADNETSVQNESE